MEVIERDCKKCNYFPCDMPKAVIDMVERGEKIHCGVFEKIDKENRSVAKLMLNNLKRKEVN